MNLAKKGFTLIELLVVIAIIGILAAIILPVYAQAKKGAFRSSDMSNMDQLRTALQLYKADQGGYPPALLGYVTLYGDGPTIQNMVPANDLGQVYNGVPTSSPLYPKRVNSINTFQPAMLRGTGSNFNMLGVNPVWPNGQLGGVGNAACAPDANPAAGGCNLQRFGQTTPVGWCDSNNPSANYNPSGTAYYYDLSGYDVASVTTPTGPVTELHYSPWWTGFTVPDECNYEGNGSNVTASDAQGNPNDNPRQLGYSDPPDSTVVTWDSFFRDYENGAPLHEKQEIVLFLGGDARPYDSADVAAKAWQVGP